MKNHWRIAVASTDGKVVNEHFGRADSFLIVDIFDDGTYKLVETRSVTPLCNNGEHTEDSMYYSVMALNDCAAVVVARIGVTAKKALEINKISVFEITDYIDIVIKKLFDYYRKTNYSKTEDI
ncbi:MAG: NifB/NifX family molybdenum-iron cluster-binding protein [Mobilitalea sp.]